MTSKQEYGVLYPQIDGYFFDGDGTLYATEELLFEVCVEMLALRGHAFTEAYYLTIVGQGIVRAAEVIIETFGLKDSPEAFAEERTARLQSRLPGVQPMPGALGLLDKLRYGKTNAHSALVTSASDTHVTTVLGALGIRQRFKLIVTADTPELQGRLKPDPEPYRLAAKKLHVKTHRCIAFEDTAHGAESAKNAGMIVVGCPHRFSPREKLEGIADYVIPEGQTIGDFEVAHIQQWLPQ